MKSGVEIYFIIHYIVFLCIFFDFTKISKRIRHVILISLTIFIVFFGGLRWHVGGDWLQYYTHFQNITFDNMFSYYRGHESRPMEFGFTMLNAVVKYLFGTFWMYNLLTGGLIQFIRYKMSRLLCGEYALTCYCLLTLLSSNYFARRAELATGIVLLSFYFIKKRNVKRFIVSNLFGYLIHLQSAFMFPFYWIGHMKLNWKVFLIVLISFSTLTYVFQSQFIALAGLAGGSDVGDVALHYATQYETVSDGSRVRGASTIVLNFLFAGIFLYVRKKLQLEKDFWYNALLNMFLIQTGIYIVFSDGMSDLCRLGGMLVLAKVILMIMSADFFRRKGTKIQYMALLAFYAVYIIMKIQSLDHGSFFYACNVPYKTIFDYNLF